MIDKKKRFLIIGLGLLGGSYAMGLKKRGHIVSAIDINEASINYALEKGIIDEGATTADPNLISQADVIISGLYPKTIVGWISENQQYFKKNALITDVTGVKCSIIYKIQELLREDCEFIVSHPMAG